MVQYPVVDFLLDGSLNLNHYELQHRNVHLTGSIHKLNWHTNDKIDIKT